jgi:prepilin-type N-terminal cleavage/methylation domain-containing protein
MKKLKAFTLIELIIGMIIGSIVVGSCYTGYSFVLKQYYNYKQTKDTINEAMLLHTLISTDFNNARILSYKENNLQVALDSVNIMYSFEDSFILRKESDVIDTFYLQPKAIHFSFLKENDLGNIIDELFFEVTIFDETKKFHYSKQYSSDILMKYSSNYNDGN